MDQNALDHETRNALVGMALELRRIVEAMAKLEKHLKRIDKAVEECGDSPEAPKINS